MFTNNTRFSRFSFRNSLTVAGLVAMPLLGVSSAMAEIGDEGSLSAPAGTLCKILVGYQFTTPANWRTEAAEKAVRLRPAGASENEIYALSEEAMAGVTSLTSPQLPAVVDAEVKNYLPFLTRSSVPSHFKTGCGPALAFSYTNQGKADCDGLLLMTVVKRRVVFLLALAPTARLAAEQKALFTVFGSLTAAREITSSGGGAVSDNSPLAQEWNTRLRNKKLVYMSSYSSGNSGGFSSQKELRLFADGHFTYTSSSSVSVYVEGANGGSAGRKAGQGTWNILVRGNTATMIMIEDGQKVEIPLQYRDSKTFLNGARFFVVNL